MPPCTEFPTLKICILSIAFFIRLACRTANGDGVTCPTKHNNIAIFWDKVLDSYDQEQAPAFSVSKDLPRLRYVLFRDPDPPPPGETVSALDSNHLSPRLNGPRVRPSFRKHACAELSTSVAAMTHGRLLSGSADPRRRTLDRPPAPRPPAPE